MNYLEAFKNMMKNQEEIALATSNGDVPNVRIVNFVYDEDEKKIMFTSFKENQKVKEFGINDTVAFTTIPSKEIQHVKAKSVKVKLCEEDLEKYRESFIEKFPSFKGMLDHMGDQINIYEIPLNEVAVVIDMENMETISL